MVYNYTCNECNNKYKSKLNLLELNNYLCDECNKLPMSKIMNYLKKNQGYKYSIYTKIIKINFTTLTIYKNSSSYYLEEVGELPACKVNFKKRFTSQSKLIEFLDSNIYG